MKLILASSSPRRREILALLGLPFEVVSPRFDERTSQQRAIADEVLEFAIGKAASVAEHYPASLILGSDTMISLGRQKIGKPADLADARKILRALAGKMHRIFTSVVVLDGLGGPGLRTVEDVCVKMRDYNADEIERYLDCDESLDKAGAYSIQGKGRALIEFIRGDYLAAVGLPLKPVAGYLKERGVSYPADLERLYGDRSFLNWRSFQT